MPFIGLIPFLQIRQVISEIYATELFQCPLSGLFHFYVSRNDIHYSEREVSMPFIGLIPFLQYLPETLAFCGFLSLFLQVFD